MKIKIYGHFTCATKYKLIKRLYEKDLLKEIELIDVGIDPFEALYRNIVSVPAVFIDDRLFFSGVLSVREVSEVIERKVLSFTEEYDFENGVERIKLGILDSAFLSLNIFVFNDLYKPFLFRDFIEAVSRLVFYKKRSEEDFAKLRNSFIIYIDRVKEDFENDLIKAVAKIITRDMIHETWPEKNIDFTFSDKKMLRYYILAKISLGRIGSINGYNKIHDQKIFRERIDKLHNFLQERWNVLIKDLYDEYTTFYEDEIYRKIYWSHAKNL